jgi:hypothetical protein
MEPFVIKWGDIVCQVTEDMTRTLPGQGNVGAIPVYTDPSGFCSWDTLKDSIISQDPLDTTILISGNLIVDSKAQSNSCGTGALVVNGGAGIAKNLFVCGNLTVSGTSNLNGNVNLGNTISDVIRLYGTLHDNAGNGPLPNQVLVGQANGQAFWQNDNIVETLTYGAIWRGNSSNLKEELLIGPSGTVLISNGTTLNWSSTPIMASFTVAGNTGTSFSITEANTLSILGGTGLSTVASSVDTVTINHANYGTAGTYAFPSSITTNAQGHITSITAGTGVSGVTQIVAGTNITISPTGGTGVVTINSTASPTITADNGLTMNTATNVQLGGTLIQNTTINSTFNFIVNRSNAGTAIQGINSSSGNGLVGSSISGRGILGASGSGIGVNAVSGTFRAGQFSISPISDDTVAENTIFQRNVENGASANDGIGQSLIFEQAVKSGSLAFANALISKFTSTGVSARTSEFSITGVNAGTTGDKLILSGNGTLRLPDYGVGNKPGTSAYSLSVTSTGNVIETAVPNYAPQVYASMLTQIGNVDPPSTILIFNNIAIGGITLSWSRISAGLYELTCSAPIFDAKVAIFATPDINSRVYCIALERILGDATRMRLNTFNPNTGNSEDDLLDRATFKIEYYQ